MVGKLPKGPRTNGPGSRDREGNRIPWTKIRTLYEIDERRTYKDLAEEFGLSKSSVARRGRREGWGQGRERFQDKVRDQAAEKAAREISSLAVEHLERHLEELSAHCSEAIARRRQELDSKIDHLDVDEKSVVEREHLPEVRNTDGTLVKGKTVTRREAKQRRRRLERFDEVALRQLNQTLRTLVVGRTGEVEPEDDAPPVEVE